MPPHLASFADEKREKPAGKWCFQMRMAAWIGSWLQRKQGDSVGPSVTAEGGVGGAEWEGEK